MTDTTTAEAELAALEQAAIDGEPVTADQLSVAREKVTLAGLIHRGQHKRAAEQATKDAAAVREQTKHDVADLFATSPHADLLDEYDAAVQALLHLVDAVNAHNALLDDAANRLHRGGVATIGWDRIEPEFFDRNNTAWVGQGNQVNSVTSNGIAYRPEIDALWARAALQFVAEQRDGLALPLGGRIAEILRGDRPVPITERMQREAGR